MYPKQIIEQAKAFLCWDKFTDLTIKLVPLKNPVAFYDPPSETYNTIIVFYPVRSDDFLQVLFLLFHETGHYLQFQEYHRQREEQRFWDLVNSVDGPEKRNFEREAWEQGAAVLKEFLRQYGIPDEKVITQYISYADQCVKTYLK